MALPKRRHSKTRSRKKRAHWKLFLPNIVICPHCGAPKLSHRVCPNCGFYGDKEVMVVSKGEKT